MNICFWYWTMGLSIDILLMTKCIKLVWCMISVYHSILLYDALEIELGLMGEVLLYRGYLNEISVGFMEPGEEKHLEFIVSLFPCLGNECQGEELDVQWVFSARGMWPEEEIIIPPEDPQVDPGNGRLPQTGTVINMLIIMGIIFLLVGMKVVNKN